MDRIKFRDFTFMENPETFEIRAVRAPLYTVDEMNTYEYTGLGPLCRIISGSGVFRGEYAYEDFNTLQVMMGLGRVGDLIHPIWGTMPCYLTELVMLNESREKYIAYKFTFWNPARKTASNTKCASMREYNLRACPHRTRP